MTLQIERPAAAPASAVPVLAAPQPQPRRPGGSSPGIVTLVTVTALALWFLFYELVLSGMQQSRDQQTLYARLRQGLAEATVPIGGAIQAGTPIALLTADSIGLRDVVVVEGTASAQLREGPGHLRSSVLPGQPGAAVLFGRGASFGAVFRRIGALQPGAAIAVTTGQGAFTYHVIRVRRPGDRYAVTPSEATLQLVSAEGTGVRSGWAPDQLVFVDAILQQGTVQPAPPGRPASVPPVELAMRSDTSRLTTLVLWLQALLVAAVAVAWSWQRWGRWQTWLIGSPVVLAGLWGATETAATLLPNLV